MTFLIHCTKYIVVNKPFVAELRRAAIYLAIKTEAYMYYTMIYFPVIWYQGDFFKFILGIYKLKEGWTKNYVKMVWQNLDF